MASNISVQNLNGVKVYDLSSGKTMPQWLSESKRRQMSQSAEYRHRVELVQDFRFPSGSQCLRMSRDGKFCVASGVYPPRIRTYELSELAMKFERYVEGKVVKFEILSEDYRKMALLREDRYLEFHAPWGYYYRTRIPDFGRDLAYDRYACNLYVGASKSTVYRLDLEQGRFLESLKTGSELGVNAVEVNEMHQLIGCACASGFVKFYDPRASSSKSIATLNVGKDEDEEDRSEITSLQFSSSGLRCAIGTEMGVLQTYDMRSSRPEQTRRHQYEMPLHTVKFLNNGKGSSRVLSADRKVIKLWDMSSSSTNSTNNVTPFAAIETPADSAEVAVVPSSGLLFVPGEQERIMTFYIPELGPAPRWCHFLDGITEELEETQQDEKHTVFNNYKFITKSQIETLGLGNLVGTPMLRAYMHGFFIDVRLYRRVVATSSSTNYDKWVKDKIKEKTKKRRGDRINIVNKFKVNSDLAKEIIDRGNNDDDDDKKSSSKSNTALSDDRFSNMFQDEDFAIDRTSQAYMLRHGDAAQRAKRRDQDNEDDDDDDNIMKQQLWDNAFAAVEDVMDEEIVSRGRSHRNNSDSSEEEDGEDVALKTKNTKKKKKKKKKNIQMYEARMGVDVDRIRGLVSEEVKQQHLALGHRAKRTRAAKQEKLRGLNVGKKEDIKFYKGVREISFVPTTTTEKGGGTSSSKKKKKKRRREMG